MIVSTSHRVCTMKNIDFTDFFNVFLSGATIGVILVIFALAGAAGAAYYYIKFVKGRKPKDEDMDFFDDEGYEEEPYINEDEEPQIAEDAETDGDED